jgi:hypothetical protein
MQTELQNLPDPANGNIKAVKTMQKQAGSHKWRHFKALMKKNAINWRRTLVGSLMELICPVVLMMILVYARTQVATQLVGNFDIYQLKKPFFPTAVL